MNDRELPPPNAIGDPRDAELDAMLVASDDRLLRAIRRDLDIDAGLAQILGDPALRGPFSAASAALDAEPGSLPSWSLVYQASDVSCRVARLRFEILTLRNGPGRGPLSDTAAALLSGAAASLKDLNRGLEAHELTRYDAISLLDQARLALEKAHETQQPTTRTWRTSCQLVAGGHRNEGGTWLSWLLCGPTWTAWLAIVVPMAAALGVATIPAWILGTHFGGLLPSVVITPAVSGAVFLIALVSGGVGAARALRGRAIARARRYLGQPVAVTGVPPGPQRSYRWIGGGAYHGAQPGPLPGDPLAKIEALRAEFSQIQPDVLNLFGDAGQCAPYA
jgi:hypothetical protein